MMNNFNLQSTTTTHIQNPSYIGYLDNLINSSDLIILDADTLQKGAAFDALIRTMIPLLKKHNRQIIFPQAGLLELKHLASSLDQKVAAKARHAQEGINALFQGGILIYKGDPHERETAGAAIVRFVAKNIWNNNILVLSQSSDVAADCKLYSRIKSAKVNHTVTVKRISDQYGRIQDFLDAQGAADKSKGCLEASVTNTAAARTLKNRFGI